MSKPVKILQNHQEAERMMLEQSFDRTPEKRMAWLFHQIRVMQQLNPTKKHSQGFKLQKTNG